MGVFDKSPERFPIRQTSVYLGHCGVSPLYDGAARRLRRRFDAHRDLGFPAFHDYVAVLDILRRNAATLLRTDADNLAFVKNTSEALSMVAAGFPFRPGDRVVSYVHEYPANHYPWRLLEQRGVELVCLPNSVPPGVDVADEPEQPVAWDIEALDKAIDERTRIVALSHVQFTSGYAADLDAVGALCRRRHVHLVIDAAQSLGSRPVYPEAWGIAALAASGWKWLLGPVGTGLFYTAPEFRDRLGTVMAGAEMMHQGTDYLDHTWAPHASARRFEYSTSPVALADALSSCLEEVFLRYAPEAVHGEILRLQDTLTLSLDPELFRPLRFAPPNRSGILSFQTAGSPQRIAHAAARNGVIVSVRGGYLRVAPHFYNSDEDMRRAAAVLNTAASADAPSAAS